MKISTIIHLLILLTISAGSANADIPASEKFQNNPVIAIVDGKALKMDDIKSAQIHDAMEQLYRMQIQALKRKALEQLATVHPELTKEAPEKVTEEDIQTFYKTAMNPESGDFETIKDDIRKYLLNVSRMNFIEQQYQTAVDKGWVNAFLTPPTDFHLSAQVGDGDFFFNENDGADRKIFLLEFSDFQCPFCQRVQSTLADLRKRYGRDVQFGYRHFPLPFHKEAVSLAEASECARDQGKFWELQALFYDRTSQASDLNRVMGLAKTVGIKRINEFKQCWMSGKYKSRVENDIRDGRAIGIQGTPTFILGLYDKDQRIVTGEMFSGAVPEERFSASIEKFLKQIRNEDKVKSAR
jgi:protein-disulfide isomerase